MSLFQKTVEQKYLKQLDAKLIETKYNEFKTYFGNPIIQENIRNSKEEQFQEGFLRELFVKILGYTLNPSPDFNLTTEYKNIKDSKKADGAIIVNSIVKGIIELKGTDTTDLSKVESQAFGYKNNQTDCVYIVTSNFEKLRFYIDNAIEHIEFNLFMLSKQDFEILYLCLAYDSIAKGTPKKIKDESLSHEDKITKDLYRDYSVFKNELYQNLVKLNPQVDSLTLYKKSQKLLDRFLFLFFAEDRNLLPPNSVRLVLNDWKELIERDEVKPLYDRYKKYFEYLNTGYKGKRYDVFAYNGGLFKPDEILDKVVIDDDLLYKHTLKLSDYDFASEVDVNILGHIFENSLNELDELKAQQEGQEIDKSKTKRKKDGVFYTPKYITKYIVENTIGKLCLEKKAELQINEEDYSTDKKRQLKTKQALLEKLNIYSNWLLKLTICDPACGSGAFLNQALDFLISEHRYIDELKAKLYGVPMILSDIEKSILENNLFGVDLNEESVEIAKLSLWLRTAQPNRKLNDLNNNIKCGNSLIDDPTIAGDKAFNWQKEFPKIFQEKLKKAFHITFVLHNSRYSQAHGTTDGLTHRLNSRKEPGFIARTFPEFTEQEQEIVAEELAKAAKEYNLNVLECNVCNDHVHSILVCEEEELSTLVGKWKGRTAFEYNRRKNNQGKDNRRVNPSVEDKHPSVENEQRVATYADGTKEKLWAKSFHQNPITDDEQMKNTIHYIQNNRQKHNLPPATNGLTRWLKEMRYSYEHAFRTEYKGGFDVVIGNPPYVDIKALPKNIVEYIFKFYKTANNRVNLFSVFIEKATNIMKVKGNFSFIIPSSLLTQESYKLIRYELLTKSHINNIVRLPNESFGGSIGEVKVDTIIFSFTLSTNLTSPVEIIIYKGFNRINEISSLNSNEFLKIDLPLWLSDENYIFRINSNNLISDLISKIEIETIELVNCADFCLGLTPYDKYKGHTPEQIDNRVFHSSYKKDETFKKFLAGNDISRYYIEWNGKEWISYGKWLGAPRESKFFTEKRILVKQIIDWTDKRIWAAMSDEELYNAQNAFNLIAKENYITEYLLLLINSKLISFYHKKKFLEEYKDRFQKILIKDCKCFPIKTIAKENQQPFVEKAGIIISLNKELQELSQKFHRTIQRKFFQNSSLSDQSTDGLTRRLENWYILSYSDFISELGKKKVKLSLSDEADWEAYFLQESKKAFEIKSKIESTDKEIDQMVYKLYELSEEEIKIVEGND